MARGVCIIIVGLLLAGCNASFVPESTPTFAPTHTASPSPTDEPTRIAQLATSTASPTRTVTPSRTTTPAPPTDTLTPRPTDTPSPTNTVRPTPLPALGAATRTPRPTDTPTATETPTPTDTATNTNEPTRTPRPTNTPIPPTAPPSSTPDDTDATLQALMQRGSSEDEDTNTPRPTLPPPTLDATPTYITAEASTPVSAEASPLPFGGQDGLITSPTPTPPPTVAISVPIPPTVSRDLVPVSRSSGGGNPPGTRNFVIGSGSGVSFGILAGVVPNTILYQQNPANPAVFAGVNPDGSLYLQPDVRLGQGAAQNMTCWPLDGSSALSVVSLGWSPNGQWLAFVTTGRSSDANPNGVFVINWQAVLQGNCAASNIVYVMPNCPTACDPGQPGFRTVRVVRWSPGGDALILEAEPSDIGRRGVFVRSAFSQNDGTAPLAYDYGNWSVDGSRILVSGANPQGQWVIAWTDRTGSSEQIVFDGTAAGLYVRDAIERPGGNILALAAADPYSPVRLITGGGQFVSGVIGDSPPAIVVWNAQRNTVGVTTTSGRRFVVNVSGAITELEAGGQPVNFLDTTANTDAATTEAPTVYIPEGVIEGSQYQPAQQVQYVGAEVLNIRGGPGTGYAPVGVLQPGTYVAILAGPAENNGFTWWQIQSAGGIVGWIAGTINGRSVLSP
jgi:hypothetical protein